MGILLIDNYDSFTWNLFQMLQAQTKQVVRVVRNDELTWEQVLELQPERIILSPGPGLPENDRDFGVCKEVILRQQELNCPVLGVCLGHQGIVHHLGGKVIPAPDVVHGKTSSVRILKDSPLLAGLPNPFKAMRYHSWAIEAGTLPPALEVLAETDDAERVVMALRHRERALYGVQFHPESIGTPEGAQLLGNFLALPTVAPVA